MSERFFIEGPLGLGPVELEGSEAHHLAQVCRLRPDDRVILFNGDGREYSARVLNVAKRSVSLEIEAIASPERELPIPVEVAVPLPRGDRGQFLIEKLTEIGITSFQPLVCQRSVVLPKEGKREKLERYVIEASKQCGRNVLMQVREAVDWKSYTGQKNDGELRVIAHFGQGEFSPAKYDFRSLRLAVGPEGGFTPEEVDLALKQGWHAVDLGPRILRVETAALVLAVRMLERAGPGSLARNPEIC